MAKINGKILAAAALLSAQVLVVGHASADSARFILREYGGKVALFCDGEEEPTAVYQTQIGGFYPADRELLEKGICLNSREELRRLIEDLGLE